MTRSVILLRAGLSLQDGVLCFCGLVFGAATKCFKFAEMSMETGNKENCQQLKMGEVIRLSPLALKILLLYSGVYLFFLCQNCPLCTQVDYREGLQKDLGGEK